MNYAGRTTSTKHKCFSARLYPGCLFTKCPPSLHFCLVWMSSGKANESLRAPTHARRHAHIHKHTYILPLLCTKWAARLSESSIPWKALLTDCLFACILWGGSTVNDWSKTSRESGDQLSRGCKWRQRSPFNYARAHARTHRHTLNSISLSTREARVIDHEEERVREQARLWCGVTEGQGKTTLAYYHRLRIDRKRREREEEGSEMKKINMGEGIMEARGGRMRSGWVGETQESAL